MYINIFLDGPKFELNTYYIIDFVRNARISLVGLYYVIITFCPLVFHQINMWIPYVFCLNFIVIIKNTDRALLLRSWLTVDTYYGCGNLILGRMMCTPFIMFAPYCRAKNSADKHIL